MLCKHCNREQDSPAIKSHVSDQDGHRKLQSAVASNDVQAVTAILDEGLNINESELPMSHIEYAELHGNKEIINLIRERS
jgi:ankyrin repeat protein